MNKFYLLISRDLIDSAVTCINGPGLDREHLKVDIVLWNRDPAILNFSS